jgi:hypothetical protein
MITDGHYPLNFPDMIEALMSENKRLREFAQWVSDRENMTIQVSPEIAKRARAALEGKE